MHSAEIIAFDGMDYVLVVGRNAEGRRVIKVGMREIGMRAFEPVIEMDVDYAGLYKDTISNILLVSPRDEDDDDAGL